MFTKTFWKPIMGVLISTLLIIAMIIIQNREPHDATFWICFVIEFITCLYLIYLVAQLSNKLRTTYSEQRKWEETLKQLQETNKQLQEANKRLQEVQNH